MSSLLNRRAIGKLANIPQSVKSSLKKSNKIVCRASVCLLTAFDSIVIKSN